MQVLLLGATGNLGSRLVPALLAHGHHVVAYVRSPPKLQGIMPPELLDKLVVVEGDAFDTDHVAEVLREHACDAIVNTAGTVRPPFVNVSLSKLVESIITAAITVGKERGTPLRAWITGGMGSLQYPGTGYQIQDYLPKRLDHHQKTEKVMKAISTDDLQWSLLCVAMMYPESEQITQLSQPRRHNLVTQAHTPPNFQDHWVRAIPLIGIYLNLFPTISSYRTKLEEVADLVADDLARGDTQYVGELVGYKTREDSKSD